MAQAFIFITLFITFFFKLGLLQCDNLKLQKPIISPECELVGICDNVENYPTELAKRLIDKLKRKNTIFNYEEVSFTMITYRTSDDKDQRSWHETTRENKSLNSNVNNAGASPSIPTGYKYLYEDLQNGNETPWPTYETKFFTLQTNSFKSKERKKVPLSLCETKTQSVSPKSAIDMNGNWQFIINDSEEPVQVFRIETCRAPIGRCSENIGFIPGYDGACIQNMVLREMYYVNETKEIDRTFFKVPTCCSCVLIRKGDVK